MFHVCTFVVGYVCPHYSGFTASSITDPSVTELSKSAIYKVEIVAKKKKRNTFINILHPKAVLVQYYTDNHVRLYGFSVKILTPPFN